MGLRQGFSFDDNKLTSVNVALSRNYHLLKTDSVLRFIYVFMRHHDDAWLALVIISPKEDLRG